jgi:chemotaxis regulatin CheY-phosphate phosphatase CheZ
VVTVDSKQFFICLNASEGKIANLNSRGLAISQEWTKFVKDETEIEKYRSLFQNIKPLSEAYASREGLIFCRPTGVRMDE